MPKYTVIVKATLKDKSETMTVGVEHKTIKDAKKMGLEYAREQLTTKFPKWGLAKFEVGIQRYRVSPPLLSNNQKRKAERIANAMSDHLDSNYGEREDEIQS
jgi:hypothetical protein